MTLDEALNSEIVKKNWCDEDGDVLFLTGDAEARLANKHSLDDFMTYCGIINVTCRVNEVEISNKEFFCCMEEKEYDTPFDMWDDFLSRYLNGTNSQTTKEEAAQVPDTSTNISPSINFENYFWEKFEHNHRSFHRKEV